MKRTLIVMLFGVSCGPQYTSPKAQDFDDLEGWGSGIEDFDPVAVGPQDTAVGSSIYDGIYLGTYTLNVSLDNGTECYCSEGLTISIEEGSINVGQATQCTMDCGYVSELRFDGIVQEDGTVSGPVVDEAAFAFGTPWTGLFTTDGIGQGGFNNTVDTNLGSANVVGDFNVLVQ